MPGLLTEWDGRPVEPLGRSWGVPVLEVWDVVSSTNDRARQIADAGGAMWSVVVADEQTAGRGRRGRSWHSPPGGGLWMTVLVPAKENRFALPLVVGVAVAEAIDRHVPASRCLVKWPNDLLIDGRKVGGILCEARPGCALVGIGVNLQAPEEAAVDGARATASGDLGEGRNDAPPIPATGLWAHTGVEMAPGASELCGTVVDRLRTYLVDERGPEAAYRAFRGRDALEGGRIHSETEGEGWARGVAEDGSLILERPDGSRVHVVSGSVRQVPDRP